MKKESPIRDLIPLIKAGAQESVENQTYCRITNWISNKIPAWHRLLIIS